MEREAYNLLRVIHFLSALTFVPRCCQECAKTEGEPCGGELGFSGTCEPGLSCQRPGPTPAEGTCAPAFSDHPFSDHPPSTTASQRTWNVLAWTSMWVESELLFTTSRVRVCKCKYAARASVYVRSGVHPTWTIPLRSSSDPVKPQRLLKLRYTRDISCCKSVLVKKYLKLQCKILIVSIKNQECFMYFWHVKHNK